jgi:predicted nucleic acid-binding protein
VRKAQEKTLMPPQLPALIATDLCVDLARGVPEAVTFFENPPVEIRLSTVTYLELLGQARTTAEQRRLRRFVAPYAVLSLGPMASSRAVELVLEHHLSDGLQPMQALMAATALAHEIPLYTRNPNPFRNIPDLEVVTPY